MMFYTYILKSLKTGRKYIGHTKDIEERLIQHNAGYVRCTKPFRPYEVVYTEQYNTLEESVQREKYFKTHKGYNEIKYVLGV